MSFRGVLLKLGLDVVDNALHLLNPLAGYVFPTVSPSTAANAKASTGNLDADDWGTNITNTGASGAIVLTLLTAVGNAGKFFRVYVTVAQQVSLSPQTTESIYLAGSGTANKDVVIAGTIGNYVDVYCDGTQYHVVGYSGVVTKEA
jgi:hypothetical protein